MAFTPTFGTGFETGSTAICTVNTLEANASYHKTGSYSARFYRGGGAKNLEVQGSWLPGSDSLYTGFWLYSNEANTTRGGNLRVNINSSYYVELRNVGSGEGYKMNAFVNGSSVATSNYELALGTWHHFQVYVLIANSGGRIITYVDGNLDIDYTGDTQPSATTTITGLSFYSPGGGSAAEGYFVDDWVIGSGGWPGDIRFDYMLPDGDSSVSWDPSSGSNYECVDERGPSETDYVSTDTDGEKDKYTLSDWDDTDKTPSFVVLWAYVKKDDASASNVKLILDDGTESSVDPGSILTTSIYVGRLATTAPGGGAWSNANLDGLIAGVEAVIA